MPNRLESSLQRCARAPRRSSTSLYAWLSRCPRAELQQQASRCRGTEPGVELLAIFSSLHLGVGEKRTSSRCRARGSRCTARDAFAHSSTERREAASEMLPRTRRRTPGAGRARAGQLLGEVVGEVARVDLDRLVPSRCACPPLPPFESVDSTPPIRRVVAAFSAGLRRRLASRVLGLRDSSCRRSSFVVLGLESSSNGSGAALLRCCCRSAASCTGGPSLVQAWVDLQLFGARHSRSPAHSVSPPLIASRSARESRVSVARDIAPPPSRRTRAPHRADTFTCPRT